MTQIQKTANVSKAAEKQILYCVVLAPDVEDLQGDVVDAETIEKAAHEYLKDFSTVGFMHATEAHASVVESFVAPVDMDVNEQRITKGSWVIAIQVHDPELWAGVKDGTYTGVSIGGSGVREDMVG